MGEGDRVAEAGGIEAIAGEQFVEKTGEVRDVRMPVEQVRDLVERRLAPGCLHVKRDPGGIEEGGELAGHAKG